MIGGAERQLLNVARYLDRYRWEVTILLAENRGHLIKEMPDDVKFVVLSGRCPGNYPGKALWAIRQAVVLRRFLRNGHYDVILTFLWLPTLLCALALCGLKVRPRFVCSVQFDLDIEYAHRWFGWLRLYLVKAFATRLVDYFIIPSKLGLDVAKRFFSLPSEMFSVIPNAIDLDAMNERLREAIPYPKPKDQLRLISIGRLVRQKGYEDLLAAVAFHCVDLSDSVEFLILGGGLEERKYKEMAKTMGISSIVKFLGEVENPYAWLRDADIFVMPSRWEPFGIALIEAMAVGLPVVATETDGPRDIIEPGVDGILVSTGDIEALGQAILKLCQSPDLRVVLAKKAKEKAAQFDAPNIAARYDKVLSSVVYQ